MFKPIVGLLLLVALCAAETPTRYRTAARRPAGARVRFLARQEVAPAPAPTGYPAAGVTPEIPFDLPSSTVKPDVSYLPPDNTYGPPSPPQPDATYGPPAPHSTYGPPTEAPVTPAAVYGPPDNSYLPPEQSVTVRDVNLAVDVAAEEEEEEANVEEQQPSEPQPEVSDEPKEVVEEAPVEDEGEELYVAVAEDGSVIAVSNSFDAQEEAAAQQSARLVFQRFPQGRRRAPTNAPVPVPVRLIKARRVAPAKLLQRVQPQPKPQPQGFSFASQYTAW